MNETTTQDSISNAKAQLAGAMRVQSGAGTAAISYMQAVSQHERCECHECTQARWKMFGGGGLAGFGQARL